MEDCKATSSLFYSTVKVDSTYTTLKVDDTSYFLLFHIVLYFNHTHPGISFIDGLVIHYMKTPLEIHWKETKRILQYILGKIKFGIHYILGRTHFLVGFNNFDWVSDPDD